MAELAAHKILRKIVLLLFIVNPTQAAQTQSCASPGWTSEKEGYKLSVQSRLVQIFTTVTHRKQPVLNLHTSDFEVTEDGNTVNIAHLDNPEIPLYVALLVDISESVRDSLPTIQDAAVAFVNSLRPDDRLVLVLFNSDIQVVEQVTESRESLLKAIRNSKARDMTKLYEALHVGMKYLESKSGRRAIVCFTDGEDTASNITRASVLDAAARYGFPIYAIGAGAGLGLSRLQMILRDFADINGGKAFFLQSLRQLRETFTLVASELRSAYVLSYYTQVLPDGQWHELSVKTKNPAYSLRARRGFFAEKQ